MRPAIEPAPRGLGRERPHAPKRIILAALGAAYDVGDRETRAVCQSGQLIDRIAASARRRVNADCPAGITKPRVTDGDPTTRLCGEDDLTKLVAESPSSRSDQGRGAQLESGARFGRDAPSERSIESEGPQACNHAIAQAHPRGCHSAGITLTADEQDD